MYGGRVIDNFDRRVVRTYMNEYLGDFLFDYFQPFHFYTDKNVDYVIPPDGTKDEYLASIEQLPLLNVPGVFGLHPNAEIGYYTTATKEIWSHLIDLQPQTGGGEKGMSREDLIRATAMDILGKLPKKYDVEKVRKGSSMSHMSPLTVVLVQELERFNVLIGRMTSTLRLLCRALIGEVGMDSVLDNIASSLFNGHLPNDWRRLTPQTCKSLGGWMEHFDRRVDQFRSWIFREKPPQSIWLSGLHIPESFLTAVVQVTCRENRWPLDKSTLYTCVTSFPYEDSVISDAPSGCYIHGLHLEGAQWDLENNCLRKSWPKVLVSDLPVLHVIPIESHRLKLQNTLRTPVYTTSNRRNAMGVGLVFEADLRTTEHSSLWVLQGVCLTLNTD